MYKETYAFSRWDPLDTVTHTELNTPFFPIFRTGTGEVDAAEGDGDTVTGGGGGGDTDRSPSKSGDAGALRLATADI